MLQSSSLKKTSGKRDKIIIKGARVNNLKNIDLGIPKNQLVVVTGLSGSGKSSLAFDLIYAEGNRRYLEGMSSYARQFLEISGKPDVDKIENLSPTISIDQKSVSRSPRSTVGTLTEIYDYLRVLFAKIGVPHCPKCGVSMSKVTNQEILEEILKLPDNTQLAILARTFGQQENIKEKLKTVSQLGYARVRIGGKTMLLNEAMSGDVEATGGVEIVVDRITHKQSDPDKERIVDSIETAFKLGGGFLVLSINNEEDRFYNKDFVCPCCLFKTGEITPKHFSFNSPYGACLECSGLGKIKEADEDLVAPNKNLSIAEGAIMAWNKCSGRGNAHWTTESLEAVAKENGFSLYDPLKNLNRNQLDVIFYGNKKESGHFFEGVVPGLMRKYKELDNWSAKPDIEKYMIEKVCPKCGGKRLKNEYLSVKISGAPSHQSDKSDMDDINIKKDQKQSDKKLKRQTDWCGGKSINDIASMDLVSMAAFLKGVIENEGSRQKREIMFPLIKEIVAKAKALENVGLGYLSISRSADSISGGEAQRIRLATQIGSELSGIIYVLDEPSIGLHNRDTEKLISTMRDLKNSGNSLVVVEHDAEIMKKADWIIDMGPGAGEFGGEVIFQGSMKKMLSSKTSTAKYLSGKELVSRKNRKSKGNGRFIKIFGAAEHNLKNFDIEIPLGKFVAVSGVSGSGKSTLVRGILTKSLARYFFGSKDVPGAHKKITGLDNVDKAISIGQSPIGRTPRSNAATYTGVFSLIRDVFAKTPEAQKLGFDASRFSFNMKGGRCGDCQGEGMKKIEMHLLPDMYVRCESCQGTRYNARTLQVEYQGVNIAHVLDMSVSYALRFFKKSPLIMDKLQTLEDVGLGYLKLGQSATNLSGGEAQRIKLAAELSRKSTGKTLYILDEPTIGLHFEDVKKLLCVLNSLVERKNTVVVVEHNLDVIKNSDWVIDLGPDGGDKGGEVIYAGTPEGLKKCKRSWTGKYL